MKIKKLLMLIPIVMLALTLAAPVSAADSPSLPHYFYGTVTIDGAPAPIGTSIEARADGVTFGSFNPIVTTEVGKYGSADPLADVSRLLVQGNITDGAEIGFYVNGIKVEQTAVWHSAGIEVLNLAMITPPTGGGGGGGGGGGTVQLDGLTGISPLFVSNQGVVLVNTTLGDPDGNFTLNLPLGTSLKLGGLPLTTLTAVPVDTATLPPEPRNTLVLAYDFGPNGAVFEPPITLTMAYDPATLPPGTKLSNLKVAYRDTAKGIWIKLEGKVDPATNTITVQVEHFTDFAIMVEEDAAPAPETTIAPTTAASTTPAPETTIASTTTAPTTPAPETTIAPTTTTAPTTPAPETTSAPATQTAAPVEQSNIWPWIVGGVIGAAIVAGVTVFAIRRRQN